MDEDSRGGMAALVALALAAFISIGAAQAQNWPSRPIRVLTSAPGSPYDVVMRGFSGALGQALGQPVIAENRAGANFIPIAEGCLKGGADGHTICTANLYMVSVNPHIYPKLSYGLKDFQAVIHFGHLKGGLIVHPSVPAGNPAELFALARTKPGTITFGTPGPATLPTMLIAYLKRSANVVFVDVPYKTFIQAATAVVANEVAVGTVAIGQALALSKAGRVKLLSTNGPTRSAFAPSLPSLADFGIDLDLDSFGGILAPAGAPREVVLRLNAEFKKAMARPGFKEKFLESQGFEQDPPSGGTPEEFTAFLRRQDEKFSKLVPFIGGLADVARP
ncbi:MAG: tripartite tricarboxylate transporter substrate binding protein [Burkholderiales bacterium]|nr:tripartite tricarboxylate transporter substrate binding protein [Burkholderiales bacterium]